MFALTRRRRRWAFRLGVVCIEIGATLAAGSLAALPSGIAACGLAAAGLGLIVLAR